MAYQIGLSQNANVVEKPHFLALEIGRFCGFLAYFGRPENRQMLYCFYINKTGADDVVHCISTW